MDQLLKETEKLLMEAEQDPDDKIRQTLKKQARRVVRNAKKAIQEEINNVTTN